ncbi:MAG: hemerythrin domain-containing protein [Patescibacteria group bacterium]|jgi:hemerythrin superfamily protein
MKSDTKITSLMIKSHQQIEQLINQFEKSLGRDSKLADKSFLELRIGLEQHFLTEEKAIFAFSQQGNDKYNGIPNLIQQHGIMLEMINNIKNQLATKKSFSISEFKTYIGKHRMIEEGILYPKLDAELNESQKQFIIKKIEEIPSLTEKYQDEND